MPVRVRLHSALLPPSGGQRELVVEAGQTVRQVLAGAGIPAELVAVVIVNGDQQEKDYLLRDGDEVRLLAVIGGG